MAATPATSIATVGQETKRAVADVRIAIALTFLTLGLLAFAIGMTWYTPRIGAGIVRVVPTATAPGAASSSPPTQQQ